MIPLADEVTINDNQLVQKYSERQEHHERDHNDNFGILIWYRCFNFSVLISLLTIFTKLWL